MHRGSIFDGKIDSTWTLKSCDRIIACILRLVLANGQDASVCHKSGIPNLNSSISLRVRVRHLSRSSIRSARCIGIPRLSWKKAQRTATANKSSAINYIRIMLGDFVASFAETCGSLRKMSDRCFLLGEQSPSLLRNWGSRWRATRRLCDVWSTSSVVDRATRESTLAVFDVSGRAYCGRSRQTRRPTSTWPRSYNSNCRGPP